MKFINDRDWWALLRDGELIAVKEGRDGFPPSLVDFGVSLYIGANRTWEVISVHIVPDDDRRF